MNLSKTFVGLRWASGIDNVERGSDKEEIRTCVCTSKVLPLFYEVRKNKV